jgi:hypothetical protein
MGWPGRLTWSSRPMAGSGTSPRSGQRRDGWMGQGCWTGLPAQESGGPCVPPLSPPWGTRPAGGPEGGGSLPRDGGIPRIEGAHRRVLPPNSTWQPLGSAGVCASRGRVSPLPSPRVAVAVSRASGRPMASRRHGRRRGWTSSRTSSCCTTAPGDTRIAAMAVPMTTRHAQGWRTSVSVFS